jgi:hypothetical protein
MARVICAVTILLLGVTAIGIPAASAVQPGVVAPPASIPDNCSSDVSQPMQAWLQNLPADTTVVAPPGACYLINEGIRPVGSFGLTISGGTWEDATTPQPGASPKDENAEIWLVGGSHIALENMTITGVNPGGYEAAGAFMEGIRSDGVLGLNVANVKIDNVYGDGIELAPLRGANDLSGQILNPTKHATISNVDIDGSGRQGITLASVDHALISSVQLDHVGLNVFDVEADQGNEGAANVTIDGCTAGYGNRGLFFANGGAGGGGEQTRNITVENCTMAAPQAGDAVLIQSPANAIAPRGPFTFADDTLRCGVSVYVACVQVTGADVSVNGSTVVCPPATIHESVYNASQSSTMSFGGDYVTGYGRPGSTSTNSSVTVSGGVWQPYVAVSAPSPIRPSAPAPSNTGGLPADAASVRSHVASVVAHGVRATSTGSGATYATSAAALASDGREPRVQATALTQSSSREAAFVLIAFLALATAIGLVKRRRQRAAVSAPSIVDMLGRSSQPI